ncbi:hypothetical protein TrVE_jg1702 [Triparma verrucosa]|uniref:Uncharacterized protein n=1 Tax=Triparma verrucosa TaxID=1606542 RepID=A0A9W7B7P4_9STRA|nr:hypothetical protein TrVE_jg1702 [Triparma verrucosa]
MILIKGQDVTIKFARKIGSKKKTKEKKNEEEEGGGEIVEMTDVRVDIGLGSRKNSVFEAENPMSGNGGEQISGGFRQEGGGESEQREVAQDEDGNDYWYDESSGRATWSDKSQS